MVDLERQRLVFPPEIFATPERPDIVIWSVAMRTVIMIELTCPSEEGFEAASVRKENRYKDLVQNIRSQQWNPVLVTVEVGVRGYVATSMLSCLHKLGFSNREVHQLRKAFSQVAARCSYGIYLSRKNQHWDRKRELLVVPTLPNPVRDAVRIASAVSEVKSESPHPLKDGSRTAKLADPDAATLLCAAPPNRSCSLHLSRALAIEREKLKGVPWTPSLQTVPEESRAQAFLSSIRVP